jgi:ribonucleoside-diphosphate reductase alpha chain
MYKRSEVEEIATDFFRDSLTARVWLDKYALKQDYDNIIERHPDDTIVRLSKELYRIEQTYSNPVSYEDIYNLLKDYNKFVLAGSCLFGIGNNFSLSSLGNCFVVDSPEDSIGGIYKTDQELAQIMKRRGGVGVDISPLRAKGRKINNAASSSTGIRSWMEQYSSTTRRIAQEGRRGALMLSMSATHEDIEQFITAKDNLTEITGANISVRITDDFMKSLVTNEYNQSIWNKIIYQAWKSAEPGLLFWDRIIENSPADCYEGFQTISTNPCSELPLCAYDSCRLASINLFAYVTDPFTDHSEFEFEQLYKDTIIAQRIMDDIVDLEEEKINAILHKIESDPENNETKKVEIDLWNKIKEKLLNGRRTGLGMMGLADVFAGLGIPYGYEFSVKIAESIARTIAKASYSSSIILARERGSFPIFNSTNEKDNKYIQRIKSILDPAILSKYNQYGRRNIANLTIAPTGSISMLARTSSGIEPVFALSYNRKRKVTSDNENKTYQDKNGDYWEEYQVNHPGFQTWKLQHPNSEESIYGISVAHKIDPYAKIKIQSVMQSWVDHSISVTYNLPEKATVEDVNNLYIEAWKSGLKGITVYREGSREGVLTTKKEHFIQNDAPKRPKVLPCDVYSMMSKGKHWIVCVGLYEGKPYEVFAFNNYTLKNNQYTGELIKSSSGKYNLNIKDIGVVEDITKDCSDEENLLTRMISTSLRHGADMKFVVTQLSKSEGDITSFGKAIARTLKRYVDTSTLKNQICPDCGSEMISEGGCVVCKNCGNNKCD